MDKYKGNQLRCHWIEIYQLDNAIHRLNNWGQTYEEKSGKDPFKPVEKILNSFKPFIILFKIHTFFSVHHDTDSSSIISTKVWKKCTWNHESFVLMLIVLGTSQTLL